MQFPVPQFTDVEDKIIGSLTVKQFGIIFGVGTIIFLAFSATKSIAVTVVFFLIFGLPGLGLALVPFNGRPMYNSIGKLFQFILIPKVLVFHKELHSSVVTKFQDAQVASQAPIKPAEKPENRIKQLDELLRKTAEQEREVAAKIH